MVILGCCCWTDFILSNSVPIDRSIYTSNVTGRHQGQKQKLRAGYRASSLKRRFYLAVASVTDILVSVVKCSRHNIFFVKRRIVCFACILRLDIILAPGYLCDKFHIFQGLHCWASLWRKTAYSINQSLVHPAYLMCREPKFSLRNIQLCLSADFCSGQLAGAYSHTAGVRNIFPIVLCIVRRADISQAVAYQI